ncbi:MAG: hypothetical protein WCC06_04825 [Candidatus Aminicenantales bacterium]
MNQKNDKKIQLEITKLQLDISKLEQNAKIATAEMNQRQKLEMSKSIISAGQAALKASMLINGGAAVALLAFFGNIWSKELLKDASISLVCSLTSFGIGILISAIAAGSTHLTQLFYGLTFRTKELEEKENKKRKINLFLGHICNFITIALVIWSYIIFALGVFQAKRALVHKFIL